jgi:hypothetical protein
MECGQEVMSPPTTVAKPTLHGVTVLQLAAMPGIAYITDPGGRVVAYGRDAWDRAAGRDDAPALISPASVIGHSIFDAMSDPDLRLLYRGLHRLLLDGLRKSVAQRFISEHGRQRHEMLVQMRLVALPDNTPGVLHVSRPLADIPPKAAPEMPCPHGRERDENTLLRICSYCRHVHCPGCRNGCRWMLPANCLALERDIGVRLSHGCCPDCYAYIVVPQLDAYNQRRATA